MYLKKELYELLKTNESIFDFIQESALDGLWYWDLENPENEWMNAKFWTVLGYNPNEMPHKTNAWQDIINQDDLKLTTEILTKHFENPNIPYDQIVRYTHKNGSTVWIRCRGMAVRDKDGKPIRMLGAHQDISDIKNKEFELIIAKEKAEENERKFREITENITEVFWLSSTDFQTIFYVNPAYEKVWGRSCQSLYDNPESFFDSVNQEDKPGVFSKFEKYRKGKKINLEYRIINNKGNIKWVRIKTVPVKNSNGEIVRHVGIALDISNSKRFQQTLTLLANMAKSFIHIPLKNISKEIKKTLGTMGNFVNADRVYIFDYDWEKQICKNTYEWCNDGITPEIEHLQEVPLDAIPWWVEAHKKGEKLAIANVSSLNKNDGVKKILDPQGVKSLFTLPLMQSGKCVGFMGFDNVRKHHKYSKREEMILTFFSELMVNIQNRKSQENLLVLEKEKAEQSDKLKTAFINNISHEIRTPLNGILGFGQMLAESDFSAEERAELLNGLSISSSRLMSTITDYIDMSMIFSDAVKVDKKEFLLKPWFEGITEKAKVLVSEKNIDFEIVIPSENDNLKITTDPKLLEKILDKLLDNAIKFTNEGSVTCTYKAKPKDVEFFVQDTGKGIAGDKLELIFEMFSQEDSSMTRGHEGSGLGLKIAKELVGLLGGEMNVVSEIGKGSIFTFTIPL
ncbi:PAS domain-containing sensor histidine kinase [Gelidibacter salicanalis]|uniref:histidine kinase n=1 Tax=Gelidibacter salicanalis TaxID=291193 RepID=A0A934NKX0_9FLAO|nr:PAS domain-containing protein [Gelidibacter salicanalis]MBJ7882797.1 PAS domain-containing protein [Gelidibacter salicanalis]